MQIKIRYAVTDPDKGVDLDPKKIALQRKDYVFNLSPAMIREYGDKLKKGTVCVINLEKINKSLLKQFSKFEVACITGIGEYDKKPHRTLFIEKILDDVEVDYRI